MSQAWVELERVNRAYGVGASAVSAVQNLSLSIAAGSFVTIIGDARLAADQPHGEFRPSALPAAGEG